LTRVGEHGLARAESPNRPLGLRLHADLVAHDDAGGSTNREADAQGRTLCEAIDTYNANIL